MNSHKDNEHINFELGTQPANKLGIIVRETFCTKCRKKKKIEEFHKKGDRRASQCAICITMQKREWRKRRSRRRKANWRDEKLVFEVVGTLSPEIAKRLAFLIADTIIDVN